MCLAALQEICKCKNVVKRSVKVKCYWVSLCDVVLQTVYCMLRCKVQQTG